MRRRWPRRCDAARARRPTRAGAPSSCGRDRAARTRRARIAYEPLARRPQPPRPPGPTPPCACFAPGDRPGARALAAARPADSRGPTSCMATSSATAQPRLKPDWSPDLALVTGYQGRPWLAGAAPCSRRLPDGPVGPIGRVSLALDVLLARRGVARRASPPHPRPAPSAPIPMPHARAAALARHRADGAAAARSAPASSICYWPLPVPAPPRQRRDPVARPARPDRARLPRRPARDGLPGDRADHRR